MAITFPHDEAELLWEFIRIMELTKEYDLYKSSITDEEQQEAVKMGCMADYDEDCEGKKPEGCMCYNCCVESSGGGEN